MSAEMTEIITKTAPIQSQWSEQHDQIFYLQRHENQGRCEW